MWICAIDEAGCLGTYDSADAQEAITPLVVLVGIFVKIDEIKSISYEFTKIKKSKFESQINISGPNKFFDAYKYEVKGSDLRKHFRKSPNHQVKRHRYNTIGFLDLVMNLCEKKDIKFVSQIAIKSDKDVIRRSSLYCSAIQYIMSTFQNFLESKNTSGIVIADSRSAGLNSNVSHSITTQKLQRSGSDPYSNILFPPLFAHSDNHAVIQISDLLASAFLFPMASNVYLPKFNYETIHYSADFSIIRDRYKEQIQNFQYRYYDNGSSRWNGGVKVTSNDKKLSAKDLFK